MDPNHYAFLVLAVGIAVVIGGIVVLRVNAFISLITAAIVVSLMAPGDWGLKINRVAAAFGSTAGAIGIVIAMAAIIGKAMMDSGAADRVVRMFLSLLGEKRSGTALMGSGYVLSIPVFFDTAFYLLVPLARSLYRQTQRNYVKYLMAIAAGGAITHTLVPPTPGPLFIANQLSVDVGTMILMGAIVGLPSAAVGLLYANWLDKRMPIPMRPYGGESSSATDGDPATPHGDGSSRETVPPTDDQLPPLWLALAPILLPIALVTANSIVKVQGQSALEADQATLQSIHEDAKLADAAKFIYVTEKEGGKTFTLGTQSKEGKHKPVGDGELTTVLLAASDKGFQLGKVFQWTNLIGNPNLALLLSAAIAVGVWVRQRNPGKKALAEGIEQALMSGGVIILITAAGGAFGGMLKALDLAAAVQNTFGASSTQGIGLLFFSFGIASLIKFAQGSSTSAMIVTSGMIAAMMPESLGYHPVYLALAIGGGSLVGSWMNDSGFWIFSKMGVLTEVESLKSWTPLLAILGLTAGVLTLILAMVMPMAG